MTDIIDLNAERESRNRPDPDCMMTTDDDVTLYLFSMSYKLGDHRYSQEIWAESAEEAKEHIAAIRRTLRYDGMVVSQETW